MGCFFHPLLPLPMLLESVHLAADVMLPLSKLHVTLGKVALDAGVSLTHKNL